MSIKLKPSLWRGIVLVIIGSILLSTKGIFAKYIYALGLDFERLSTFRAILAVPGFFLISFFRGEIKSIYKIDLNSLLLTAAVGLLCYYFGSLVNFYALTKLDAGLERVLLFTYPSLVVIIGSMTGLTKATIPTVVSILVTFVGISLIVGAGAEEVLDENINGAGWVGLCALTIAIYLLIADKLIPRMGSSMFTLIAMTFAALGSVLHIFFRMDIGDLIISQEIWILLLLMVIFATVIPLAMIADGIRQIGAQRAAIASTVGPPATAIIAIFLLGERLFPLQVFGIIIVILAILYIELHSQRA